MRIFFDTEFIEDGRTIDLISIGMIREDGLRLYLENSECDLSRACPWVRENVFPHLIGGCALARKSTIADAIKIFVGNNPEFWAWFGSYDWVVLCQLYGRMVDLPKGWPMFVRDLRQICDEIAEPFVPKQKTTKHNALNDAIWTMEAFNALTHQRLAEALQGAA